MSNGRILIGFVMLATLAVLQLWQLQRLRELKRETLASVECSCQPEYR